MGRPRLLRQLFPTLASDSLFTGSCLAGQRRMDSAAWENTGPKPEGAGTCLLADIFVTPLPLGPFNGGKAPITNFSVCGADGFKGELRRERVANGMDRGSG